MKIFCVVGYGVPKDIETDDNYCRYLGIVFNSIYAQSAAQPEAKIGVIFGGGYTDVFKPYRRTEAGEMARFFKKLAARPACRVRTRGYQYFLETKSLSTLENIIYARNLLRAKKIKPESVTIFCEATRARRIKQRAKNIFGRIKVVVAPVDFDLSSNRYLEPVFLAKKEKMGAKLEDWALRDPANLREYRRALIDKFKFFRQAGAGGHQAAVREWWERRMKELGGKDFK